MLYTVAELLPISKKVELINKCEFIKTELNENANIFVVYVGALEAPESAMSMHLLRAPLLAVL